jgi:hypothetical protein
LALNERTTSSDTTIKIDALSFLTLALATHTPTTMVTVAGGILPHMCACIGEQHKVSVEALSAALAYVRALAAAPPDDTTVLRTYVHTVFNSVNSALSTPGIDQEVREKCITCAAQLVADFAPHFSSLQLASVVAMFADRMGNELMRLVAVKAFITLAHAPAHSAPLIDMTPSLGDVLRLCGEFLRKNQRVLKLSTLTLLQALLCNEHTSVSCRAYVRCMFLACSESRDCRDAASGDGEPGVTDKRYRFTMCDIGDWRCE